MLELVPLVSIQSEGNMTSKTELKELIEALREEIRGLRKDVANLQIMINNQNKSTISNIPFTSDPNRTCPTPYPNVTGPYYPPNYTKITCSDDI